MITDLEIIAEKNPVARIARCAGVPPEQSKGFMAQALSRRLPVLRHARIRVEWPPELRAIDRAVKRQRRDFDPELQSITARMEYNAVGFFTMDLHDYLFFFPGAGVEEIERHENAEGYLTVCLTADCELMLALACSSLSVSARPAGEPGVMEAAVTGVYRGWGRTSLDPVFAELMEKLSALPAYPASRVSYWKGVLNASKGMQKVRRGKAGQ